MEWYNKQDIQKDIQNRRKHQKIKRCFTVAQRTKHIGDHIIKNSCARSEKNDKHVIVSFAGNILRNLHPPENLVSQQAADQSQDYGKNNTEQCGYSNTFAHAFFVLCTTPLAKADTESTGKTIDKAKEVLDNTDDTVFLISKDIETCLKLVEKGVELPAINVGAVPNEEGRKLITTGVAISQKELDMLEELNSKGIEITVQPMPEISAISFDAVKRKM